MRLRSLYDREIVRLAVPALGALAAEPLYVLVDTAIVGHLGTVQLAALGLAGAILTGTFTLFNFLEFGTTGQVARYHGAGREAEAGMLAAQSLWIACGFGAILLVLGEALAGPVVRGLGGGGRPVPLAVMYLRIGSLGLPFALIAMAAQGYLRGVSRLRTPFLIVLVANLVNVALEVMFVYGFRWGLAGSAWGTVVAQAGMGAAYVRELLRAPARTRRPRAEILRPLLRVGGNIFVRTGSLYASFLLASAVLARIGAASLAAHQIAFQLWNFLALVLDAIAVAGQVIVGRALGAGDPERAWEASLRMLAWSLAIGLIAALGMLALIDLLPHAFTTDPHVLGRLRAIWPIFALMQPANALVFAFDGILMGAGDTRFLMWGMVFAALVVYVPVSLLSLADGWGIVGVWCGLLGLIVARFITCAARFAGRRWAVVGVPRAAMRA